MPPDLDAIVLRALERDRNLRFPDARSVARALEGFLAENRRAVSRAEIGEWLDDLFPGSQVKKKQLVELTRRGDSAMPVDDGRESAPTEMFRPAEPTSVRGADADAGDPPDEVEPTDRLPAPPPTPRALPLRPSDRAPPPSRTARRSSPLWLAAAAVALVSGGAFAYLQPWADPNDAPETLDTTPAAGEEPPDPPEGIGETPRETHIEATPEEPTGEAAWPPFEEVVEEGPPGHVHVDARGGGWAEIRHHQRVLGRTPLDVELLPGRHRLVLTLFGDGEPRPLDVEIRSGRHTYMNVTIPVAGGAGGG